MRLAEIAHQIAAQALRRFTITDHLLQAEKIALDHLPAVRGFFLVVKVRMLDQIFCRLHVPRGVQQNALRIRSVASGTARFLIICLDALRHIIMNHIRNIRFIDSHTERVRRNDDGTSIIDKRVLIGMALLLVQSGMIAGG